MEVLLRFWAAARQAKAEGRARGTVEAFDAPDARAKPAATATLCGKTPSVDENRS
jgi:hypothetical protein